MKKIQVYDPAMCCPTGICGPEVDPALVAFAADVKWLQERGVDIQRFGLAQNPAAFVENEQVRDALTNQGEAALPLVIADGVVVASGRYPARAALAAAAGLPPEAPGLFTDAVAELVAIGAAVAANCEPCLRFHVHEAQKLGVSQGDIQRAVELAANVKGTPHRNVMRLAERLAGAGEGGGATPASPPSPGKRSCCA